MGTPLRAAAVPDSATGPVGHRGTRAALLVELKRAGVATAASLAAALECAINTIRHHLKDFEGDNLVVHDRTHHGVGAPQHAYRLSPKGHALFPDRYADTLSHLLDHVVKLQGRAASVAVLQAHYGALGDRICDETAGMAQEARGEHIARALDGEGFMAIWQPSPNGGVLTEHNCPHRLVAERFPEVCADEEAFLARAFGAVVERQSRIASGCGCCSYQITVNAAPTESGS
jgi:DeoR family transcriptional regulator, suf operon transcriptional repressor